MCNPAVVLSLSDFKSSSTLGIRQITNLPEQSSFSSAGFVIRLLFCFVGFQILQNVGDMADFKSARTKAFSSAGFVIRQLFCFVGFQILQYVRDAADYKSA